MKDARLHMSPHTKAKHKILEEYLKAWFPILSKGSYRVLYLDGFAGPGEYDDGSFGSPVIALEVARTHKLKLAAEVLFIFIEKEEHRYTHLTKLLKRLYGLRRDGMYERLPTNFRVYTYMGDFNEIMSNVVSELRAMGFNLAPTLAFIDPFGYADINIQVLADILSFPRCELLITYMVNFLDRFASDEKHKDSIKKALLVNDTEIEALLSISSKEQREKEWLRLLKERLLGYMRGRRQLEVYDLSFRTIDRHNNTMYYLVYFTKSTKGMRVMKEAMWKVGVDYKFSDFGFMPGQSSILDYSREKVWVPECSLAVHQHFTGKTVSVKEIEDYVTVKTKWLWRKSILEWLERHGKIEVLGRRTRMYTYPNGFMVKFK
jgi:three-Cys-motif partner protein